METTEIAPRYDISAYGEKLIDIAVQVFNDEYAVLLKTDAILCATITSKLREATGQPLTFNVGIFKKAVAQYLSDDIDELMTDSPFLFAIVNAYFEAIYALEADTLQSLIDSKNHINLQKYQFILSRAPKVKANWAEAKFKEEPEEQKHNTLVTLNINVPEGVQVITSEEAMYARYNDVEDATVVE